MKTWFVISVAIAAVAVSVAGCSSSRFPNSCGTSDPMTGKCLTAPWINGSGGEAGAGAGGP